MASLVIAEHDNKALKDATAKTVTAAAADRRRRCMCWSRAQDCGAVAEAAAKLAGVEKVLLADDALYAKMVAEPMETLILSLADKYDAILAPATTNGKNYLPRVAAKLDVPQISRNPQGRRAPDTFERPIYAGNAIADRAGAGAARRSSPCAPPPSRRRATAAAPRSKRSPRAADPGTVQIRGRGACRNPNGPN